jgi:hypothetical protein
MLASRRSGLMVWDNFQGARSFVNKALEYVRIQQRVLVVSFSICYSSDG